MAAEPALSTPLETRPYKPGQAVNLEKAPKINLTKSETHNQLRLSTKNTTSSDAF